MLLGLCLLLCMLCWVLGLHFCMCNSQTYDDGLVTGTDRLCPALQIMQVLAVPACLSVCLPAWQLL